jgi:N-acetyl-beta-hexosaminidase
LGYYYLDAQTHSVEIAALRQAGRLYASTVNAVLLTEAGYQQIRQELY